jgi:hypothetical protein
MKDCRVYFRDTSGVEHGVPVTALHRYHAYGLALAALRKCPWSNPNAGSVDKLHIELIEGTQRKPRITVTRQEFETWLSQHESIVRDQRQREYIKMLLGRIEPDRDFKRGLRER